jgi:hypothetical protein
MTAEYRNSITLRGVLPQRKALIIDALSQRGWDWVTVHVEGADRNAPATVHRGRDSGISALDFYSRGHPGRGIWELSEKYPAVKLECCHNNLDTENGFWVDVLNCQVLREKEIKNIHGDYGEPVVEGEWEYTDEGRRVEALEREALEREANELANRKPFDEADFLDELKLEQD